MVAWVEDVTLVTLGSFLGGSFNTRLNGKQNLNLTMNKSFAPFHPPAFPLLLISPFPGLYF